MRASLFLLLVSVVGSGCAGGGVRDGDAGPDSGTSSMRDSGSPRDAGPVSCPAGQHPCGGGCIDDLPNEPENGCRLGCGEPCPSPPDGSPMCNGGGTCGFGCEPPFRQEGMECVCTPTTCEAAGFSCGAPDDGCLGNLDCGSCEGAGICNNGHCECPEDDGEPNEGRAIPASLGAVTDLPTSDVSFADLGLHTSSDEDWYSVQVTDEFDISNPDIVVTLDAPAGDEYTLSVEYICSGSDSCNSASPCSAVATPAAAGVVSFAADCSGTDESGTLLIQITPVTWSGMCSNYSLRIQVT